MQLGYGGKKGTCATRVTFVRFKRGDNAGDLAKDYIDMSAYRKAVSFFKSFPGALLASTLIISPCFLSSCSNEPEKKAESNISLEGEDNTTKSFVDRKGSDPTKNPDGSLKWDNSKIISKKKFVMTSYMRTGQEEDPVKYYFPQIQGNSIPKNDTKRAGEQLKTNQFGVQYADLEQGTGLTPGENGLTMIHYVGWLPDGTMFYNSISRGQPIQFHMGDNKVIPGIQYGLVGMKVGGTRKMMIPAKLAWGAKGLEGKVPPNTPVVCVVKLLTTGRQVGRQFLKPSEVSGTTESPASQE